MVYLLESSGLHCQVPKASVSRSTQRLSLLNQLESSSPSYLSCNLFHGRSRPLVSFYKGSTCKQPIVTLNCRFISSSMNNFYRTEAGMNFFRKKQSQKQSKNLQSILIRSALYFVCKQNFLFDFLLNNWSEFDKIVLNADDNGGNGGGFTFIPGLGGGDGDNFSRKRRKGSWKWWWVLIVLVVFSGVYYGNLKPPTYIFNGERLEALVIKAVSFGIFALILLAIVGSVALTGSILVASLRFVKKKSKFILFPPRRRRLLSVPKSITSGTLLSTMVLSILYPKIPKALVEGGWCSLRQLKQTTDSQMKASWKKVKRAHKKVTIMFNTSLKRDFKSI
ncbi:uncharacterized protein LOC131041647 [Cryptomeria japonica]|uniref:uncharacterized protein LOC131041647 n=1 Tax=Cryptomeria japonica TaxID=3369 RepID=UPI0027DA4BB6|nr:uncharacterized protein LOC131041647 [Cryptomeria japonica]